MPTDINNFENLLEKISPRLKKIIGRYPIPLTSIEVFLPYLLDNYNNPSSKSMITAFGIDKNRFSIKDWLINNGYAELDINDKFVITDKELTLNDMSAFSSFIINSVNNSSDLSNKDKRLYRFKDLMDPYKVNDDASIAKDKPTDIFSSFIAKLRTRGMVYSDFNEKLISEFIIKENKNLNDFEFYGGGNLNSYTINLNLMINRLLGDKTKFDDDKIQDIKNKCVSVIQNMFNKNSFHPIIKDNLKEILTIVKNSSNLPTLRKNLISFIQYVKENINSNDASDLRTTFESVEPALNLSIDTYKNRLDMLHLLSLKLDSIIDPKYDEKYASESLIDVKKDISEFISKYKNNDDTESTNKLVDNIDNCLRNLSVIFTDNNAFSGELNYSNKLDINVISDIKKLLLEAFTDSNGLLQSYLNIFFDEIKYNLQNLAKNKINLDIKDNTNKDDMSKYVITQTYLNSISFRLSFLKDILKDNSDLSKLFNDEINNITKYVDNVKDKFNIEQEVINIPELKENLTSDMVIEVKSKMNNLSEIDRKLSEAYAEYSKSLREVNKLIDNILLDNSGKMPKDVEEYLVYFFNEKEAVKKAIDNLEKNESYDYLLNKYNNMKNFIDDAINEFKRLVKSGDQSEFKNHIRKKYFEYRDKFEELSNTDSVSPKQNYEFKDWYRQISPDTIDSAEIGSPRKRFDLLKTTDPAKNNDKFISQYIHKLLQIPNNSKKLFKVKNDILNQVKNLKNILIKSIYNYTVQDTQNKSLTKDNKIQTLLSLLPKLVSGLKSNGNLKFLLSSLDNIKDQSVNSFFQTLDFEGVLSKSIDIFNDNLDILNSKVKAYQDEVKKYNEQINNAISSGSNILQEIRNKNDQEFLELDNNEPVKSEILDFYKDSEISYDKFLNIIFSATDDKYFTQNDLQTFLLKNHANNIYDTESLLDIDLEKSAYKLLQYLPIKKDVKVDQITIDDIKEQLNLLKLYPKLLNKNLKYILDLDLDSLAKQIFEIYKLQYNSYKSVSGKPALQQIENLLINDFVDNFESKFIKDINKVEKSSKSNIVFRNRVQDIIDNYLNELFKFSESKLKDNEYYKSNFNEIKNDLNEYILKNIVFKNILNTNKFNSDNLLTDIKIHIGSNNELKSLASSSKYKASEVLQEKIYKFKDVNRLANYFICEDATKILVSILAEYGINSDVDTVKETYKDLYIYTLLVCGLYDYNNELVKANTKAGLIDNKIFDSLSKKIEALSHNVLLPDSFENKQKKYNSIKDYFQKNDPNDPESYLDYLNKKVNKMRLYNGTDIGRFVTYAPKTLTDDFDYIMSHVNNYDKVKFKKFESILKDIENSFTQIKDEYTNMYKNINEYLNSKANLSSYLKLDDLYYKVKPTDNGLDVSINIKDNFDTSNILIDNPNLKEEANIFYEDLNNVMSKITERKLEIKNSMYTETEKNNLLNEILELNTIKDYLCEDAFEKQIPSLPSFQKLLTGVKEIINKSNSKIVDIYKKLQEQLNKFYEVYVEIKNS